MFGSWPGTQLPNLNPQNCEIKSKATRRYNCIAWAAGENFRNWWPDRQGIGYWPQKVKREETIQAFILAYGTLGFSLCFDGGLRQGFQKIAIFGKGKEGEEVPTHAALQLDSGQWTSKLGQFEDVNHTTAEAVCGPVYGRVICYLERPTAAGPISGARVSG